MGISLFFPSYNEEANVEQTIEKAISVIEPQKCPYEIIIVDDGSSDDTAKITKLWSLKNKNVVLKRHEVNRGYGSALKTGFNSARYGLVFFSDGDLQFDLSELIPFIELLDKDNSLGGVIGYRIKRADPIIRKLNAFGWKIWVNTLFGLRFKDIDCAFKLFKTEAIKNITLESDGALISAELLVRIKNKGYKIAELGVHHYQRHAGSQTGAKISVIIKAFFESFKLYKKINSR